MFMLSRFLRHSKNQKFLLASLLIGSMARIGITFSSPFPINDGGMFFVMTRELIENHFSLPSFTTYNNENIPYAYPPAGFYLAGALSLITNTDLLGIFRFLPLVYTLASLPIFYLLSRQLFSERQAISATFLYAMLTRSYSWEIMGGGITRGLGLLSYLTTMYFFARWQKTNRGYILIAIFLSITFLAHFEWALFAVASLFILSSRKIMQIKNLKKVITLILAAAVITFFWWTTILKNHGWQTFTAFFAAGTSPKINYSYLFRFLRLQFTDEFIFLPILGTISLVTVVYMFAKKKEVWLALWVTLPFVLSTRCPLNMISIPLPIILTFGLERIYHFLLEAKQLKVKAYTSKMSRKKMLLPLTVIAYLFFLYLWTFNISDSFPYFTENHREAVEFINLRLPQKSSFLTLNRSLRKSWPTNQFSEWLPALTDRKNISTAQGLEWLTESQFEKRMMYLKEIEDCYEEGLDCIQEVTSEHNLAFDYIVILIPHESENVLFNLREKISSSDRIQTIFRNEQVEIYQMKSSELAT